MTTHYVDLTVVPGPEVAVPHLIGALYDRLHLALVQQRRDDIGASFPGYSRNPRTLGDTLRLHGTDATLHALFEVDWLKGVRDHVRIGRVAAVPAGVQYRTVSRRQFKTSVARLRRRRERRQGETAEQAAHAIPASVERQPDLPYAQLRSRSTGQAFSLFIAMGELQSSPVPGRFNSHGLSGTTRIPWF